jgi:hypothetical protein
LIQTNTPYTFKERKAQFRKDAPGRFTVELFKEGAQTASDEASSPVEAKLLVLDWLIQGAKEHVKQPA